MASGAISSTITNKKFGFPFAAATTPATITHANKMKIFNLSLALFELLYQPLGKPEI